MLPARLHGSQASALQERLERQNQITHAHQQHVQSQTGQAMVLSKVQKLAFDL